MKVLGARPIWLDFCEHQYLARGQQITAGQLAPALYEALSQSHATAVFIPMGLANPDHATLHDAAMIVRSQLTTLAWFAYEDAGYCHLPGLLAWRVAKLFRSGIWPTPAMVPQCPDTTRKRAAIECYASQLAPLRAEQDLAARLDACAPEQYWRLSAPPKGWEGLIDI